MALGTPGPRLGTARAPLLGPGQQGGTGSKMGCPQVANGLCSGIFHCPEKPWSWFVGIIPFHPQITFVLITPQVSLGHFQRNLALQNQRTRWAGQPCTHMRGVSACGTRHRRSGRRPKHRSAKAPGVGSPGLQTQRHQSHPAWPPCSHVPGSSTEPTLLPRPAGGHWVTTEHSSSARSSPGARMETQAPLAPRQPDGRGAHHGDPDTSSGDQTGT